MPTREYQIQGEHTTGLTAKHYHGEAISTLNTWAKNNLPPYAVVSSVKVKYRGKVSTGDTKFYVGFTNSSDTEPGQKIISSELTTSSNNSWEQPLPFSGLNIISSYSRLNFWASSGIVMKKYTCYDFRVIWDFYIPTYTLTVKAGTGGTVTGGGTFEAGKTATITATPSTGYKFKQWNDGNTSASRSVTVTGNATYTAEFALKEYVVTTECISNSDKLGTIHGAGTYKYGDTVNLIISGMYSYHRVKSWYYTTDSMTAGQIGIGASSVISITIDENLSGFIWDLSTSIHIVCEIEHTGFYLQAYSSPTGAGKFEYGSYTEDSGYSRLLDFPSGGGMRVSYMSSFDAALKTEPNESYKFVRWEDGDTSNPRKVNVTSDATYTAFFEKIKVLAEFYNWDGNTILQSSEVEYGDVPVYIGETPTKDSDVKYTYTFKGWSPPISAITSNQYYTALFTETLNKYTITVNAGTGGTVTGGGTYDYGSDITLTAIPDRGYKFVRWSDGSTVYSRRVHITGDATYTAYFEKIPPEFTSASMIYLDKQISSTNKVLAQQSFVLSFGVK